MAVDRRGRVYVADRGNDRIQVFDGDGRFVAAWGGPGQLLGDVTAPNGVAVDSAGRVYVATARWVQVFSDAGDLLVAWDSLGGVGDAFGALGGIAVDEEGGVYVAHHAPARVLKFRPRGPWPTPGAATPIRRPATPTATPAPPTSSPRAPLTPTDR